MKNLCSKSKPKKIHPSPSISSSAAGLRLLPAAILALTAALSQEDKEVLAYLVMRSVGPIQQQSRRKRSSTGTGGGGGGPHAPVIGCGCFECYTSFWSRWDQSPNRELIHAAIDAFDDHLATSEEAKNKKGGTKRKEKGNKGKSRKEVGVGVGPTCQEVEEAVVSESGSEQEVVEDSIIAAKVLENGEKVLEDCNAEEEEEERRKGYWAEVMGGMLNLRLWGIWSSGPPPPAAMETA